MPRTKSQGNGQGCAYKRGKVWEAQVIVGWRLPDAPGARPIPIKRRKSGFHTKAEALAYCSTLLTQEPQKLRPTLQQVYDAWEPWYEPRIGATTMVCYRSAYKHFAALSGRYIDTITAGDLQECMDACPSGKRTHQNMKVTAGLLWAYAFDRDMVPKNVTENLYIGKHETTQREPITEDELEVIRRAIGQEQYAEYVYAMCYLGFRPGEFLALKKADLHTENGVTYLTGGSKTDAGRDRRVPVPPQIAAIIQERMSVLNTEYLFPMVTHNRKGEFTGYKQMAHSYFRESVFIPMMKRLGIAEGKTPYCARHTYADKLKAAAGDDQAKAALMGHTDYAFTQAKYQSIALDDLSAVADSIK